MKLTDTMVDTVKMMMFSLFQIYETDRYYGRYCEDDDVPIIFSSSNILLVQFVSTYYATASTGFNAEYTFIDNSKLK